MKTNHSQSYSSDYADRYSIDYVTDARQLSLSSFPIAFTKRGFRQFSRVNQLLGERFIRAFVLYREVAAYITAHEADGYHLDTICLDVRYDENIPLPVKCRRVGHHDRDHRRRGGVLKKAGHPSSSGGASHGLRVTLRQIICGWKRVTPFIPT